MDSEKPFDPYYEWLAIPPDEQPPDAYRLLGVRRFESNQNVISNALDQRMSHIRSFQVGKRGAVSQKLLTQLSQAGGILLDDAKRAEYDARLKANLAAAQKAAPKPLAKAVPVQPVAKPATPVVQPAAPQTPPPHYAQPTPHQPQPSYAQQPYPQQPAPYAQQPYPQHAQQPPSVYQQPPPVYVEPKPALPTIHTELESKPLRIMPLAFGGVLVVALAVGGIMFFRGNFLGTNPHPAPVAEIPVEVPGEKPEEITIVPTGFDLNAPAELPADLPVLKVVEKTPPQVPVAMPTLPTQFTADEKIAFVSEDERVCFHRLKGLTLLETRGNGKEVVWQFSRQYAAHADFISAHSPPRALRLFADRYLVYDLQDRVWNGRGSKGKWVASDSLPHFVDAARTRVATQLASLGTKLPPAVEPTETPAPTEVVTKETPQEIPPATTNPTTASSAGFVARNTKTAIVPEGRKLGTLTNYYYVDSNPGTKERTVEFLIQPDLTDPAPFRERLESIAVIPAYDRVLRVLLNQTGKECQMLILDGDTRRFTALPLRTDRLHHIAIAYDATGTARNYSLFLDEKLVERTSGPSGTQVATELLSFGASLQCRAMSATLSKVRISDTYQQSIEPMDGAATGGAFFDLSATTTTSALFRAAGGVNAQLVSHNVAQPLAGPGAVALQTNGSNQVWFSKSGSQVNWESPYTIEAQFKWGTHKPEGVLFSYGHFALLAEKTGNGETTLRARFHRQATDIQLSTLQQSLPFSEFVHFCAQFDGGKLRTWVNGNPAVWIGLPEESAPPQDLMLGGAIPTDSLGAAILLKGFRVSNRALYNGEFEPPTTLLPDQDATVVCLDFTNRSLFLNDLGPQKLTAQLPQTWWVPASQSLASITPTPQVAPSSKPSSTITNPSISKPASSRPAPPNATELAAARVEFDRRYGSKVREAKRPDEKVRIAQELKSISAPSSVSLSAWKWITETAIRDLYAAGGRVKEAIATHEQLASSFEYDSWEDEVAMCLTLGEASLLADVKDDLGIIALTKSQNAIGRDQFEDAHKLLVLASRMLLSTKNQDVKQNLSAWRTQLTFIKKKQDPVIAALETLKSNPNDAPANREVGSYYSFILEEWERGRPFLQKSEDPTLTRLAAVDAAALTPMTYKAAGDAWWDYLEDQKSISRDERQIIQRHIRFHYESSRSTDSTIGKRMASFASLPPRPAFVYAGRPTRRSQEAMLGMIGRVAVNNVPTQLYIHFRPGGVVAPTDLDTLNRRLNPNGNSSIAIQIEFAGLLKMPLNDECRISFSGQNSRVVLINSQQVSTSTPIPLAAGEHQVLARFAGPSVDHLYFNVSSRQSGNRFTDFTVPPEVLKRIGYDDSKELLKWGW